MNLSPQPVTVKKNLATLTKIALFTRPEPFTIIYTEQMNIDESTVSFVCFEESNRRFYVSGSKPARGTIAVLYYLHYRDEIMPMDKEHQITDIDARGFAEVKAIMWVSVLNIGRMRNTKPRLDGSCHTHQVKTKIKKNIKPT